jgi:hypothetical protein
MAARLRHKETGLYWAKARGLADANKDLEPRERYMKRHLSKRGRIYHSITDKQKEEWIGKYANEFEIETI